MGKSLTRSEVIEQFIKIHHINNIPKYSYDKFVYINAHTKSIITCPIHGDFEQTPTNHVHAKQGCTACGYVRMANKQTFTTSTFIEKAISVHGNKYDYSNINYVNNNTPVSIYCSIHGEFFQKPIYHLSGSNCPICSTEKSKLQFDPTKETILYYVYFPKYDLYKIGITNRSIEQRFYGDKIEYSILS